MAGSEFVKVATDAGFGEAIRSSRVVVVDCWAEWCGPCKMLEPTINALAKDLQGKVAFLALNVDDNPEVSQQFRIRSIPTLFIFVDGKLADTIIGEVPRKYIEERLAKFSA